MGDANNDGVVDISDATLIQKYSSSYTELDDTQLFAGDVDGDGNIDVADVTLIQKYSASIGNRYKHRNICKIYCIMREVE